jgi:hypothetical protein
VLIAASGVFPEFVSAEERTRTSTPVKGTSLIAGFGFSKKPLFSRLLRFRHRGEA